MLCYDYKIVDSTTLNHVILESCKKRIEIVKFIDFIANGKISILFFRKKAKKIVLNLICLLNFISNSL